MEGRPDGESKERHLSHYVWRPVIGSGGRRSPALSGAPLIAVRISTTKDALSYLYHVSGRCGRQMPGDGNRPEMCRSDGAAGKTAARAARHLRSALVRDPLCRRRRG